MSIQLVRISVEEAENIWKMQIKAFYHLYEKYCDTETLEKTLSDEIAIFWNLNF